METKTKEEMQEEIFDMVRHLAFARRKSESAMSPTALSLSFLIEQYDALFAPEKAAKYSW